MLETKMLEDIEAVIFDMDGTLIDSMWIWPSIDEDFFKKYDLVEPENFHEDIEGMSYTEAVHFFLEVFPTLKQTPEQIMDEWTDMARDRYMHEAPLKEGAYEFILEMKRQGKKIGIATSNGRVLVEDTLKSLGVEEYFDVVRTACEAGKGKPAPDVYLMVADEMGISPKRCLVFEDVPMGILAGKNAGMKVCAIDDEFSRIQEEKKKSLADYYIHNYDDIRNETYEVL
ncbi:HAD family hydrolase [Sporofaciens musculi]|uniref:HAD family hydrolase n=1 Tax=Sporofaciens musculi TaxID=2681861 RepID=UPI002ED06EC4